VPAGTRFVYTLKKVPFPVDLESMRLRGIVLLVSLAALTGCMSQQMYLSARDGEIRDATQALETARDDKERAKSYSARGAAYSDKARYSRAFNLIPGDEYDRQFDLGMKDHDQAVVLDPSNAEVFFNRGAAFYDRGSLDLRQNKNGKKWFDAAAADFTTATQKDPKNSLAFDRLGLAYEENNEADKAIEAYTHEMALDSFGKRRLADAYCNIGFKHQQQNELPAAAAAYRQSIEFGPADDKSCPYDPLANGIAIYTTETHEYEKAWDMVHRALKAGRLVPPDVLARLVKDSGRVN